MNDFDLEVFKDKIMKVLDFFYIHSYVESPCQGFVKFHADCYNENYTESFLNDYLDILSSEALDTTADYIICIEEGFIVEDRNLRKVQLTLKGLFHRFKNKDTR